jgi:hypothetical protein
MGTTGTNQNFIRKESKKKINYGNIWYNLIQNPLSFHLLSKNIKIRIRNIQKHIFGWVRNLVSDIEVGT